MGRATSKPGMKELRQVYWSRVKKKGEKSALTGKWENASSGRRQDSAQEETRAVSATHPISRSKRHKHPHGLQQRRHRLTNEGLFEVTVPEEVALLEGKVKERAKKSSKELVRIRRVIIGFLSYVKITNLIGMQIRRPVTVRTH